MTGIETTEAESAAVAKAPDERVKLADIEGRIVRRLNYNVGEIVNDTTATYIEPGDPLHLLSVCILTMDNGFTVIGKAAPASAKNFNQDYGHQLAYEDAIRQLWPLMGFELRSKLMELGEPPKPDAVAPAGTVPGTIAPDDPF
jgi:hypothetical protein